MRMLDPLNRGRAKTAPTPRPTNPRNPTHPPPNPKSPPPPPPPPHPPPPPPPPPPPLQPPQPPPLLGRLPATPLPRHITHTPTLTRPRFEPALLAGLLQLFFTVSRAHLRRAGPDGPGP